MAAMKPPLKHPPPAAPLASLVNAVKVAARVADQKAEAMAAEVVVAVNAVANAANAVMAATRKPALNEALRVVAMAALNVVVATHAAKVVVKAATALKHAKTTAVATMVAQKKPANWMPTKMAAKRPKPLVTNQHVQAGVMAVEAGAAVASVLPTMARTTRHWTRTTTRQAPKNRQLKRLPMSTALPATMASV